MGTLSSAGTLIVSVDLPPAGPGSNRSAALIGPLVDLFGQFQVSATWGVSSPAGWSDFQGLLEAATPQELAILDARSWAEESRPREPFSRLLALHQAAAATIGWQPTTLALQAGSLAACADLAQKRGITATRSGRELPLPSIGVLGLVGRLAGFSNNGTGVYRPATLRFGLWDLKPSAIWPHPAISRSSPPVASWRQGLYRAIALGAVYHLVLDVQAVAQAGNRFLRGVRRFIAHAAELRDRTALEIVTVQEAAARLSRPRIGSAARSILRSRAA